MKKLTVLTAVVLAAGIEGVLKAFEANPQGAAADLLSISKIAADKEAVEAVNEDLVKEIETLSAKLSVTSADPAEGQSVGFEYEGNAYVFNYHKTSFGGKNLTSAIIAEDKSLQKELIELGSSMISKK